MADLEKLPGWLKTSQSASRKKRAFADRFFAKAPKIPSMAFLVRDSLEESKIAGFSGGKLEVYWTQRRNAPGLGRRPGDGVSWTNPTHAMERFYAVTNPTGRVSCPPPSRKPGRLP